MSYDKGKSRSGGGGGPKNRKSLGLSGSNEEGVWKNTRFAHTVTSLVGVPVSVETVNDGTYEGILWTISTFLDVVLVQSHLVDKKNPDEIRLDTLEDTRTIHAKDIVRLFAVDVDLDYATKKTFQTDYQISGQSNGPMRELEEWKPEEGDCEELEGSLESSSNGWKPEDMFAKNEQNYGVKSTYKDNLEGYTCQLSLEGRDSAEYKQREAKATEIARQIEQNSSSASAIELENGECGENEEEAFSAVVRTASPSSSSSVHHQHVHTRVSSHSYHRSSPAHRDHSNTANEDHPHGHGHGHNPSNTNKYIPPSRRGPKNNNSTPHSRSHNDRDNDNDYHQPTHAPHHGNYHHHHSHHHHHHSQQHHHHSHLHYTSSGSSYNKGSQEDKSSHYQPHRSNNSYNNHSHGKPPRINSSNTNNSGSSNKSLRDNSGSTSNNSHAGSPNAASTAAPSHHNTNVNNNNNNSTKSKNESPESSSAAVALASSSTVTNTSKKKESPVFTSPSPPVDSSVVEKPQEADPETAPQAEGKQQLSQQPQRGPSPENKPRVHFSDQSPSNNNNNNNNNNSNNNASSPPISSSSSPSLSSNSPTTNTQTHAPGVSTSSTTASSTTKKSALNPNAKEFVLNPNAKMFTSNLSRPPMSTTPSRPQTPATPVGTPFTTQTFIPGYVPHISTSTQPSRNRTQRDFLRPELTSPIQVAAAAAAAANASPVVPVSYTHHIPFQTQTPIVGTPPHHPHHPQHNVVMRMGGVLPHNIPLAAAASLEPLSGANSGGVPASPGQPPQPPQNQNQWTTGSTSSQSQQQPPGGAPQGTPHQVPLTATPPAPSHTPSPGPQVLLPLGMTQQQQSSQQGGSNQAAAPPVTSLAYAHPHHHPSSAAAVAAAASFAAASASPGAGHYPPNLFSFPHTAAVLPGHPPMIHPPMMPSSQGNIHGGALSLTTYISPPTAAVPGHQNHLLHSHIAQ